MGDRQEEARVNNLAGRVDGIERDVRSLAQSVERITVSMEHGFENTRKLISQSHTQIGQDLKDMYTRFEKARTPNWTAYGLILAICIYGITWFVNSQVEPVKEALKGETEMRFSTDDRERTERQKMSASLDSLQGSAISSTPDGRERFEAEQIRVHERIARLEAFREMEMNKKSKPE